MGTRIRAAIAELRVPAPPPPTEFEQVAARVEAIWATMPPVSAPLLVPAALVCAVIHQESGGNPDAFPEHPEREGASFGLMQLLLPTARSVGFIGPARTLFVPLVNVTHGILYLARLYQQYHSWWVALVAYNGGPRAAAQARWHLPCGQAGYYADAVMALWDRYEDRARKRARAKPAGG